MIPAMIKLTDAAGSVQLNPQPDVTAIEVMLVVNLLGRLLTNKESEVPDWRGYLDEHKLTRHFKTV